MISLQNESLRAEIVHPSEDRHLLGARFCTGGYVYQVSDVRRGALLAGPEYPTFPPSATNGQGAPEVFQNTLFLDEDEIPETKLIIGVGTVRNTERHTQRETHFGSPVETYCTWDIRTSERVVEMETQQEFQGWTLRLVRRVSLDGRTLRSASRLKNERCDPFLFRWFAHPFFPLSDSMGVCTLRPDPKPFSSPGFMTKPDRSIAMRTDYDWRAGCFLLLDGMEENLLTAVTPHALVGEISVMCDFPLLKMAIWANDRTFSPEPFYSRLLERDMEASWSIAYSFGK